MVLRREHGRNAKENSDQLLWYSDSDDKLGIAHQLVQLQATVWWWVSGTPAGPGLMDHASVIWQAEACVSEQGLKPAGWPSHSAQTQPASSAIHIERMKTKEDWVEQHLCDEQAFDALVL